MDWEAVSGPSDRDDAEDRLLLVVELDSSEDVDRVDVEELAVVVASPSEILKCSDWKE